MAALRLASLSLLFLHLVLLGAQGRRTVFINKPIMGDHLLLNPGQDTLDVRHGSDHAHNGYHHDPPSHNNFKDHMDPALNVFFTLDDLKVGKTIPIYFSNKDPSKSPRLLTRQEADSIPFSSAQLSYILSFFSFSRDSPQAKAMEYTLKQCELEPIKGEIRFCATSLESMLDSIHEIFEPNTQFRVLTTTFLSNKSTTRDPLQNYTILEVPKQIDAPSMIGCHAMPYPYAVFYCHGQEITENRLFQISLRSSKDGGEDQRVEAMAVCHMDTSLWDRDHVSFRVLSIEPGSSPVCHFFPMDNLVWVPF